MNSIFHLIEMVFSRYNFSGSQKYKLKKASPMKYRTMDLTSLPFNQYLLKTVGLLDYNIYLLLGIFFQLLFRRVKYNF
jgi:hypothetical protein